MANSIVVDISPTGTVKIDASGFKGKSCTEATQTIEVALGGMVKGSDRKHKPEFFAPASTSKAQTRVF